MHSCQNALKPELELIAFFVNSLVMFTILLSTEKFSIEGMPKAVYRFIYKMLQIFPKCFKDWSLIKKYYKQEKLLKVIFEILFLFHTSKAHRK